MANPIAVDIVYHRGAQRAQGKPRAGTRTITDLFSSLNQESCQSFKSIRPIAERTQLRHGGIGQLIGAAQRLLNSKQRRISCFLRRGVFAGSFSELLRRLSYIEYIVHNLKSQADGLPKGSQ